MTIKMISFSQQIWKIAIQSDIKEKQYNVSYLLESTGIWDAPNFVYYFQEKIFSLPFLMKNINR